MLKKAFLAAVILCTGAWPLVGQTVSGGPLQLGASPAHRPASFCQAAAAAHPGEQEATLPTGIAPDWWANIQEGIRREAYSLKWSERPRVKEMEPAWQAPNMANRFESYFTEHGAIVAPEGEGAPAWSWGLELIRWGRQGALKEVPPSKPLASGNRVEFNHGAIKEWYVNDERGLEQGFSVEAPPSTSVRKALLIDLALSGTLHPKFSEDGQSVDFWDGGSVAVLRYGSLKVTDGAGRILLSRFEGFAPSVVGRPPSVAGGIRIAIDDTDAVYPITVDPLATSPAWTLTGGDASEYLGVHMAAVGDVNGDGYSDALVQRGQSSIVELYLGSASGLPALPAWSIAGSSLGIAGAGDINGDGYADFLLLGDPIRVFLGGPERPTEVSGPSCPESVCPPTFGNAAAAAGDVNGDGYGDVVVGYDQFGATAPSYDNGFGKAYLYLGSAAGLGLTPVWSVTGEAARDLLGYTVAGAGDVNGDGYADVLVGGEGYVTRYGQARLYLGGPAGLAATAAWTVTAAVIGNGLGTVLSTAGDVNGDGYADFLTATPADNSNTGRVDLYLGGPSGPSTTPARTYLGEAAGDKFGSALATAGDVDGDGYADVAVGAQGNASNTGKVYLYRGGASGLGTSATWTAVGEKATDYFGAVLAGGGDVNGDGISDIMVSAPPFVVDILSPNIHNGKAYLYLGGPAGPASAAGWTGSGETTSNYYGWSVASAGDVNGDGYTDVVVGAFFVNSGTGKAYLYLGGLSGLSMSPAWTAAGEGAGIYFGSSVAGAGDVNGDGYADVVVGAGNYTSGTNYYQGKAYLYLGGASGLSAAALWTATGETAYSYFGGSVAGAGDVNGDGYADVVVGAYGYGSNTGRAYLYFGSQGGLSSSAVWTATGEALGDYFAYCAATAGDVNGDGYSDVVVGAYMNTSQAGKAYVYLGGPGGLAASAAWSKAGAAGVRFGGSVATAGDVNGDGYSDLLIGASYYNSRAGRAYLYLGGASGPATSAAWTADGAASSLFGNAVAPAGDVNGDGYSDVVVGAQGSSTVLGKAYIYLGSAAGLSTTAAWTGSGAATADRFGYAVASADVNGDGYSDILVGAPYNTTSTGKVYAYGGNGGACLPLVPRQLRADGTTPLAPLGLAYTQQARLGALLRSPFGRGLAKVEWQAAPLHGSLYPAINPVQSLSRWYDTRLSGTSRAELADLSETTGPWVWRARVRYNPATTPLMPHGRWFTLDANGLRETDLRSVLTAPPPPLRPSRRAVLALPGGQSGDRLHAQLAGSEPGRPADRVEHPAEQRPLPPAQVELAARRQQRRGHGRWGGQLPVDGSLGRRPCPRHGLVLPGHHLQRQLPGGGTVLRKGF